jgi:hypothetical protein
MKRIDKIASFICIHYCQSCKNSYSDACNHEEVVMGEESHTLNHHQMQKINLYTQDKSMCLNFQKVEGSPDFLHVIQVTYANGRTEKMEWLSSEDVSQLWEKDIVVDIDVVFSDL